MQDRKCKECGKELSRRQTYFCSNQCKLKNRDHISLRTKPKEKLDPTLMAMCKTTGKTFKDYKNYSGVLTTHVKNNNIQVNNPIEAFDIVNNPKANKPKYQCKYCDWNTVDVENKSGCITVHIQIKHGVSPTTHIENYPEEANIWSYTHSSELRDYILSQDESSYIECKECGMKMKRITATHLEKHNMTMDDYREKHGVHMLSSDDYLAYLKKHREESFHPKNNIYVSKAEAEIKEYIESLGIEVISTEKKAIYPHELDLYIPSMKIAIEYNGLYWHSELSGNKLKDYHYDKMIKCQEKGIRLIQVFEDEWVNKKDIVLSKIQNILGHSKSTIYARNCQVKELTKEEKESFLVSNHIQGDDISKHWIGLIKDDKIAAVMTFVKPRVSLGSKQKDGNVYELSRFASSVRVVGGASKLLNYFIQHYNPSSIISYADRRWTSDSKDTLYDKLGFIKEGYTRPNYWYMKAYKKRYHRYNFTKHTIVEKMGGDPNKSEAQNMFDLGYDRIWDCGNIKYVMIISK